MNRLVFCLLFIPFAVNCQESYFPGINTSQQARAYALDRMWTKVDVLPEQECRYVFGGEQAPKPGAEIRTGTTAYRYICDTTVTMLNIAIIDFPYHERARETTDSLTGVLLADFRRNFDFQRLVDEYLRDTEYEFGYELFYEASGLIEEMIGGNLESLKKGEIMKLDIEGEEPYRLLIYCKEDPIEVKAGILIQGRVD